MSNTAKLLTLAILASLLLYLPALSVGFLSDDWGYVYLAEHTAIFESLRFLWSPDIWGNGPGNYRPLQSIMTVLVWKPFLSAPWVLHILSMVLHGAASLLVGLLSLHLFKNKTGALVAGFVFLTLPLNSEVVIWLASWNALLAILPLLAALILYARKQPVTPKQYTAIGLLVIVSLLAKEHALVFPLFLIGIDLLLRRKVHSRSILMSVAIVALYFLIRFQVLHGLGGYQTATASSTHLSISLHTLLLYAKLPLMYVYNFFNSAATPAVVAIVARFLSVVALGAAVVYGLRQEDRRGYRWTQIFLLGILVYAAHLLGWNLVNPLDPHTEHSRILYPASIWAAILFGLLYQWVLRSRLKFLFLLYLIVLPVLAVYQTQPWIVAGRQSQQIQKQISAVLTRYEAGQTIVINNLPDQYRGAFIFRNGIEFVVALRSGTAKYTIPVEKSMQMGVEETVAVVLQDADNR